MVQGDEYSEFFHSANYLMAISKLDSGPVNVDVNEKHFTKHSVISKEENYWSTLPMTIQIFGKIFGR